MKNLSDRQLAIGTESILYMLFGIITFVFLNANTVFYPEPDTSVVAKPHAVSRPTITTTTKLVSTKSSSGFSILAVIIVILVLIAIILLIKSSRRKITLKKPIHSDVEHLIFSRDEARKLLQESLSTKKYSTAVVDAYLKLDDSLNTFRNAFRPKFWTPKEYAYRVRDPVFQPSVYKIVEIYYEIRYGYKERTREHVLAFLKYLDILLIKEVPKSEILKMQEELNQITQKYKEFVIIPKGDLTKPGRQNL